MGLARYLKARPPVDSVMWAAAAANAAEQMHRVRQELTELLHLAEIEEFAEEDPVVRGAMSELRNTLGGLLRSTVAALRGAKEVSQFARQFRDVEASLASRLASASNPDTVGK